MSNNPYLGAWALQQWTAILPDGSLTEPYGKTPTGLILYTADGYMSATVRGSDDASSASGRKNRVLCYAGSYRIGDNCVTHRVTVASVSSFIGKDQLRHSRFADNTLALTADASDGKHTIVWKKLPDHAPG